MQFAVSLLLPYSLSKISQVPPLSTAPNPPTFKVIKLASARSQLKS